MKSENYIDLLIEGKLVAANPLVEMSIQYFTGIPNNLLDIIRELDIKYGINSANAKEIVSTMVQKLGFIKNIDGRLRANYKDMNIVKDSDIKEFAEYTHFSPNWFPLEKPPEINKMEDIIRKHLSVKYQKQQTNLFTPD